MKPRTLFTRLHDCYGPQGWWPTTPKNEITPRYYPGATRRRLSDRERWEIVVGAILTQNTSWRNAEQALAALARRRIRTPRQLRGLAVRQLAEVIRSSGYYNQKAERLHGLAGHVVENYGGSTAAMLRRPTDSLRGELLSLKGIGPETADSILLYAGRHPCFVVDAYTRRICSRLGWTGNGAGYEELQTLFTSALPADAGLFEEYHALLVRHAVERCRATPDCRGCCLRRGCRFPKDQRAARERAAHGKD